LTNPTAKAAAEFIAGRAMTDVTPTSVAVLVQQVLRSMLMMKLKTIAVAVVLIGLGAFGASLAARQADSGKSAPGSRRGSRVTAETSKSKAQPSLVAQDNYVVEPPDLLLVEVLEALPGRPISGERLVRPDGKISLGFYGDVYVAGLTLPEIKEKIIKHLQQYLADENLDLIQQVPPTGEPVIDPKTRKPKLNDPKDSSTVFVDVAASKSKFFYVQGEVLVAGRMPVKGKETILDAINIAGGLKPEADHGEVILYRQGAKGDRLRAMRINIDQIMMGDDLSTNYQLEPGDRLVVPRNQTLKLDPVETDAERPGPNSSRRSGNHRDSDRLSNRAEPMIEEPAKRRTDRADDRTSLQGVEKRLSEVERKLELILDALKSGTR